MKNRTVSTVTIILYLFFLVAGTIHLHKVSIEFSPVLENKSVSSDYFHSDDFCFLIHHTSSLFWEPAGAVTPELAAECRFCTAYEADRQTTINLSSLFLRAPPEINSFI